MDAGLGTRDVQALAIDPAHPGIVYAASVSGDGVFKSTDGARSWHGRSSGLPHVGASMLALDPRRPETIYAGTQDGVFKSSDAGGSWRRTSRGLGRKNVQSLAIGGRKPQTVYAGTEAGGIFRSTDGGAHWRRFSHGLLTIAILALAVEPSGQGLYAGTYGAGVLDYRFSR
jgi:photosystem II stability/assembly factor-like uncharacterized protein